MSRQMLHDADFRRLFNCDTEKLNIAATYNLLCNGSLMVKEGMGYAICFDKIIRRKQALLPPYYAADKNR